MSAPRVGIPQLRTGQKPVDDFGAAVKEWIERCTGRSSAPDEAVVTVGDLKAERQRRASGKRVAAPGDITVDVGEGQSGSISIDVLTTALLGNVQFKKAITPTTSTTVTTESEQPLRVEQALRQLIEDLDGRVSSVERLASAAAETARTGSTAGGLGGLQHVLKRAANGAMAGTGTTATGPEVDAGTSVIVVEAAKLAMVQSSDVLGTGGGEINPLSPPASRVPFAIDGDGVYLKAKVSTAAGISGTTSGGTAVSGAASGSGTGVYASSASGTALAVVGPMTITSATLVTNLNADKLDGLDSTAFAMVAHTHTGVYSPMGHDHAGVYALVSHGHSITDIDSTARSAQIDFGLGAGWESCTFRFI